MKFSAITLAVFVFLEFVYTKEVDCGDREFICYDEKRFYQCVQVRKNRRLVLGQLQNCPQGLICKHNGTLECEEPDP
ncbi:hypothetical protein TcasGA2_TC032881 [Tribolium castaneum]|uniref:Chitin-binding type-2 domain-containing protein n=1 Tax=Tribolium castaneum TaxID=7070 RepID=A0A139WJL1_TRICA|nr:hypothetical protein TcasGA2_TC032881 [Tribolium castaneum]